MSAGPAARVGRLSAGDGEGEVREALGGGGTGGGGGLRERRRVRGVGGEEGMGKRGSEGGWKGEAGVRAQEGNDDEQCNGGDQHCEMILVRLIERGSEVGLAVGEDEG